MCRVDSGHCINSPCQNTRLEGMRADFRKKSRNQPSRGIYDNLPFPFLISQTKLSEYTRGLYLCVTSDSDTINAAIEFPFRTKDVLCVAS
jgi:hypothetical protein